MFQLLEAKIKSKFTVKGKEESFKPKTFRVLNRIKAYFNDNKYTELSQIFEDTKEEKIKTFHLQKKNITIQGLYMTDFYHTLRALNIRKSANPLKDLNHVFLISKRTKDPIIDFSVLDIIIEEAKSSNYANSFGVKKRVPPKEKYILKDRRPSNVGEI